MLFDDPAKRYPNLLQALNALGRRRPTVDKRSELFLIAGLATVGMFAIGAAGPELAFLAAALIGAAALFWLFRRPTRKIDDREKEAVEVARRMGALMAKKRLHRDLDAGSLTLLDECGRQWLRARSSLEAPGWTSRAVPEAYREVRKQALAAVDEAMVDALLHYRDVLPMQVADRHATDYVEEALDNVLRGGPNSSARRADGFLPAAFAPVREIADRLRDFAEESNRLTGSLAASAQDTAAPRPSLDQALAELRALRTAEEELRQSLRH